MLMATSTSMLWLHLIEAVRDKEIGYSYLTLSETIFFTTRQ